MTKEVAVAELTIEGEVLVLRLSVLERVEALHGQLRMPLASVRQVEVLDNAHQAIGWRGVKLPGSRIPGVVEVGTFLTGGRRVFAVVHHDTPRGLRIRLADADFDELVVGCADPETLAAKLRPTG